MWGLFVSSTMKAAIHLWLRDPQMQKLRECWKLIHLTEILVMENYTEILSVSTIDCSSSCWTESTLTHDQVKKWSKDKDTNLLGLSTITGRMSSSRKEARKKMVQSSERVQDVVRSIRVLWNRWRSNGTRVEYFPGFTTLQILQEIQKDLQCQNVGTRTILWQDHIHVNVQRHWMGKEKYWRNLHFEIYAQHFPQGHQTFVGSGDEMKWVWYQELQTWRKMEFHCSKNGTELQGDQAPWLHEYQCF